MAAITESVSIENHGAVAVITVNNPPVNALSHHVRTGIVDGMAAALADDAVTSIVLICDGRTFIAGADITEFGGAAQGKSLRLLPQSMARRLAVASKQQWQRIIESASRAQSSDSLRSSSGCFLAQAAHNDFLVLPVSPRH
jgi:enoyl-CoA hydratase/carnithine racemase